MSTATYDRIAPHYDSGIRRFERWFLSDLRRRAFEQLPPDARILELGAGTGLNFSYYGSEACGVATEPSKEMVRFAALKPRPQKLSLIRSCAEGIPFTDETFDAAIATLVFCSVESPQKAFGELRRVMKPGGVLVLLEHVRPPSGLGFLFDLMNLITVPLFHDHLNRRTANIVNASGFEVVKLERRLAGIINLMTCVRRNDEN
jgi:ubiquinone/menaquinone biosynthesis C-methylase UbiE